MRRRSLLKSAVAITAGVGLGSGSGSLATAESAVSVAGKSRTRRFIEAPDGTGLFFRDWGLGRPVVFAAPWALNSAWWEYQMAYLAGRGIRSIGYDRRGHGRSDEPSHGYDFDTLADDLAALFEQ